MRRFIEMELMEQSARPDPELFREEAWNHSVSGQMESDILRLPDSRTGRVFWALMLCFMAALAIIFFVPVQNTLVVPIDVKQASPRVLATVPERYRSWLHPGTELCLMQAAEQNCSRKMIIDEIASVEASQDTVQGHFIDGIESLEAATLPGRKYYARLESRKKTLVNILFPGVNDR
ncbi:MAG TPA: hypothetical protein VFP11_16000 [Candidatus Angelobacter sp.]|nr:hypothetical protein [Candidatus Angelobacter sp.]